MVAAKDRGSIEIRKRRIKISGIPRQKLVHDISPRTRQISRISADGDILRHQLAGFILYYGHIVRRTGSRNVCLHVFQRRIHTAGSNRIATALDRCRIYFLHHAEIVPLCASPCVIGPGGGDVVYIAFLRIRGQILHRRHTATITVYPVDQD